MYEKAMTIKGSKFSNYLKPLNEFVSYKTVAGYELQGVLQHLVLSNRNLALEFFHHATRTTHLVTFLNARRNALTPHADFPGTSTKPPALPL